MKGQNIVRCAVCVTIMGWVAAFSPSAPLMSAAGLRQPGITTSALSRIECNLDSAAGYHVVDRRAALVGAALAAWCVTGQPAGAASKAMVPVWVLENGVEMPTLALNTVGLTVEDTERAAKLALASGITHVDFNPGVERDGVARVIKSSGRSSLFLTTKIRKAVPGTDPPAAAKKAKTQKDEDLRALGVDHVDMLMLFDSPDREVIQSQWVELEAALKAGKTRSSGVLNFCESALLSVLETAKVKPAVNYHMMHIGMGPDAYGLRSFGEKQGRNSQKFKSEFSFVKSV